VATAQPKSLTVTLISPSKDLHPLVRHRIFDDAYSKERISYHDRLFAGEEDLEGMDMVLTAIDNATLSQSICEMARARKIPVNIADVPPQCDFYFGSMIRRGPLQIMVSTGGKGPKMANLIRRRLETALPDNVGLAIEKVGQLRSALRKRCPDTGGAVSQKRMEWMSSVCESWSLDELGQLDDSTIDYLIEQGWEKGHRVPLLGEARQSQQSPPGLSVVTTAHEILLSDRALSLVIGFTSGIVATVAWRRYHP